MVWVVRFKYTVGVCNLVIGGSLRAWPELFCCIKMVGLIVVVVVFLFPLVRLLLIVFYKIGVLTLSVQH